MKVSTQSVRFTADAKLIEFVSKKLSKLDQFHENIIDVNVTLKLENSGQVKDKIAEVIVNIPGKSLVVKETNKTFEAAVDKASDVLIRQIKKTKEKLREKRA